MEKRISWDDYYIKLVNIIKLRATCPRKLVGAIIVNNNKIIGTGYNGSPKGFPHCTEIGCKIITLQNGKTHCKRVIHAEINALLQAGEKAKNGTLYITVLPCQDCLKLLIQSGIKKIIYDEDYNRQNLDLNYWIDNANIEIKKHLKKI